MGTPRSFVARFRVRSYELDAFGHVNHAVYLGYFEQARFEALESGGFAPALLAGRGWGVHVVRVEVDYRREALLGDEVEVRTRVEEYRKTSMVVGHEALRAGAPAEDAVLARARVVVVWVGPDRRPMRVPDEVRSALGSAATSGGEAAGAGDPSDLRAP